jgi:hypothetical protein
MPLVLRANKKPHSIRNFRAAALARFAEGRLLAAQQHRLASIYLMGYAAEMLLKAAYFRLAGYSLSQPITVQEMYAAKDYAVKTLKCPWAGNNLHDLRGWQMLLMEDRKAKGVPYSPSFSRDLNANVTRLALNWVEALRYHPMRPYRGELRRCLDGVTWLLTQYRFL